MSEKSHAVQERDQLQARFSQVSEELSEMNELKSSQSQSALGGFSNKKNEDNYDVEAALVSGGTGGFMPLVGLLRSAPAVLQLRLLILAAQAVDKITIAVHTKPGQRLAMVSYLIMLHLYALLTLIL